jgi:hypothetical protein
VVLGDPATVKPQRFGRREGLDEVAIDVGSRPAGAMDVGEES